MHSFPTVVGPKRGPVTDDRKDPIVSNLLLRNGVSARSGHGPFFRAKVQGSLRLWGTNLERTPAHQANKHESEQLTHDADYLTASGRAPQFRTQRCCPAMPVKRGRLSRPSPNEPISAIPRRFWRRTRSARAPPPKGRRRGANAQNVRYRLSVKRHGAMCYRSVAIDDISGPGGLRERLRASPRPSRRPWRRLCFLFSDWLRFYLC